MKGLIRLARSGRRAATPIALLGLITAMAIMSVLFLNVATYAVSVYDGDSVKTVYTLSSEPDEILNDIGIELSGADEYTYSGMGSSNGEIKLLRAFPVTVDANGKNYSIETTGGTVRDVLACAGINLGEYDELNFSLDAEVKSGMTIAVTNVEYKTEIKEVELPFGTDVIYSDALYEGETKIKDGTAGLKLVTYSYKLVNGKLVDTKVTDETVTAEAINAVKTVGTKKAAVAANTYTTCGANYVSGLAPDSDFELDSNGVPVNYKKKISGIASAYSGGTATSTGMKPRTGYVAVDPQKIPYGSRLFIRCQDGSYIYGYAVAQDTGSFIRTTNRIVDLYFDSKAECVRFGLRNVDIYVL